MKPFGTDAKSFTIGGPYKWKPDSNPPIGGYDLDSGYKATHYNNRSAIIRPKTSPYKRPKEGNPDPGQYDKHLKPFGSDVKSFTIGKKYE